MCRNIKTSDYKTQEELISRIMRDDAVCRTCQNTLIEIVHNNKTTCGE